MNFPFFTTFTITHQDSTYNHFYKNPNNLILYTVINSFFSLLLFFSFHGIVSLIVKVYIFELNVSLINFCMFMAFNLLQFYTSTKALRISRLTFEGLHCNKFQRNLSKNAFEVSDVGCIKMSCFIFYIYYYIYCINCK